MHSWFCQDACDSAVSHITRIALCMQNTEFGYSRKDIILLGAGLIGLGYALYYGLQVFGVEPAQVRVSTLLRPQTLLCAVISQWVSLKGLEQALAEQCTA